MAEDRRGVVEEVNKFKEWLEEVRVLALASDLTEMLLAQERLVQPTIDEGIRQLRSLIEVPLVTELAESGDLGTAGTD